MLEGELVVEYVGIGVLWGWGMEVVELGIVALKLVKFRGIVALELVKLCSGGLSFKGISGALCLNQLY